ncbi:hypothetical protein CEE45_12830 [Candidatus Heimdallarchaeota archaeon B3_Heim]|nr:MAG: hypothetical protein CEE45_12830 [Candidatus Heimdallarchaeota archaeon B3_Heim]
MKDKIHTLQFKFKIIFIIFLVFGLSVNLFQESHETNEIDISVRITSGTVVNISPHSEILITSDSQLINTAVSGTGTAIDPYILEGWNITVSGNFTHGIAISGTTKYFVIRNNYINTGGLTNVHGIFINGVANGTARIENNTVENNYVGIEIQSGTYSTIQNNTARFNINYGIETRDGASNTLVAQNTLILNLAGGIRLESVDTSLINNTIQGNASDEVPSNLGIEITRNNARVIGNTILSSNLVGIEVGPVLNAYVALNLVDGCRGGIASWSNNSIIYNNTLKNGGVGGSGLSLGGQPVSTPTNNTIAWNLVMNFPWYAFYVSDNASGNIIHHNAFIHNNFDNPGSPQGRDFSTNRYYDNITNKGNYWHDYSGSGNYKLDGVAEDPFPLTSIDLDQDLMADGWEYDNNLDPATATDANWDLDNDSLINLFEYQNGLRADNPDTDGDGLTDGIEVIIHHTDPLLNDSDNDGLTDGTEIATHLTDPTDNDTDNDGLMDGVEIITYRTDPNDGDSDDDGVSDGDEVNLYLIDPNDDDSDDDGILDGEEINRGFDPTDPNDPPIQDPLQEFLVISGIIAVVGGVSVTVISVGASYIAPNSTIGRLGRRIRNPRKKKPKKKRKPKEPQKQVESDLEKISSDLPISSAVLELLTRCRFYVDKLTIRSNISEPITNLEVHLKSKQLYRILTLHGSLVSNGKLFLERLDPHQKADLTTSMVGLDVPLLSRLEDILLNYNYSGTQNMLTLKPGEKVENSGIIVHHEHGFSSEALKIFSGFDQIIMSLTSYVGKKILGLTIQRIKELIEDWRFHVLIIKKLTESSSFEDKSVKISLPKFGVLSQIQVKTPVAIEDFSSKNMDSRTITLKDTTIDTVMIRFGTIMLLINDKLPLSPLKIDFGGKELVEGVELIHEGFQVIWLSKNRKKLNKELELLSSEIEEEVGKRGG